EIAAASVEIKPEKFALSTAAKKTNLREKELLTNYAKEPVDLQDVHVKEIAAASDDVIQVDHLPSSGLTSNLAKDMASAEEDFPPYRLEESLISQAAQLAEVTSKNEDMSESAQINVDNLIPS